MSYICTDCPRNCRIDRDKSVGFCSVKSDIVVAKIIKNFMWEEPSLCVDKGVTAIFFAGCNLKCEFCQNEKISRCSDGQEYTVDKFVMLLKELDKEESDGFDLVSPTQFTGKLLEVFKLYKPKHKVIWNSNGYEKPENVEKLSPFVDVFLPDFKYFDEKLGLKLSQATNYPSVCVCAIKKMTDLKPVKFNGNEMIQGVIVRHLALPNETKDSLNVLKEINSNFPDVYISLMSQFVPNGKGEKNRKLTPIEYKILLSQFKKLRLKNGYMQELDSSSESFIPNF